jgi:hypothetical protein
MGGQPGMGGPPGGMPGRSGVDRSQQFWEMLAKGKSSITRNDVDPRFQRMFDMMAAKMGITNGVMTRQQYDAAAAAQAAQRAQGGSGGPGGFRGSMPGGPAPGGTPGGPSPDAMSGWADGMFRRYDQNGDGLLNNDEMPEALRIEREKFDTDRNGLVDLNEYRGYFQGRMQQLQSERGGAGGFGGMPGWGGPSFQDVPPEEEEKRPVVYRAGKLPKEIQSWFSQSDTDGDAQVGLYEWKNSGQPLSEFTRFDRNGDGFITVEEAMRFVVQANGNGNGSSEGKNGDYRAGGPPMMMGFGGGMPQGTIQMQFPSTGSMFMPRPGEGGDPRAMMRFAMPGGGDAMRRGFGGDGGRPGGDGGRTRGWPPGGMDFSKMRDRTPGGGDYGKMRDRTPNGGDYGKMRDRTPNGDGGRMRGGPPGRDREQNGKGFPSRRDR